MVDGRVGVCAGIDRWRSGARGIRSCRPRWRVRSISLATTLGIWRDAWSERTHDKAMRRQKYGAMPTVIDGIRFASKAEARRYGELRMLEKAGEISELELQPKFELKAQLTTGTVIGAAKALTGQYPVIGHYIGDFRYRDKFGNQIVEDVKSPATRTALYRWKCKHVMAQYGITIVEIMKKR